MIQADRKAMDIDRDAPGADKRFAIFPVAESTKFYKLYSVVAADRFLGVEVSVRRMSLAAPLALPGSAAISVGSFSDLVC